VPWTAFLFAVVLMTVLLAVIAPTLRKLAEKKLPQLMGGFALVAVFLSLLITTFVIPGMQIGSLATWVGATVLVWIGSLVASFLLPSLVFRDAAPTPRS
jgi:ABC-type Co2+ transport system permease subunit